MAVICYRSRQTVKSKQMLCACTKSLIFCSFSLAAVCVRPSLDTQPGLASIELSFHPCNILRDSRRVVSRGNKNVGCGTWKWRFFALAVRITGKLLNIDWYMLLDNLLALNCLFIHTTFSVIAPGASPGEPKMWAAVRENGDYFKFVDHVKTSV